MKNKKARCYISYRDFLPTLFIYDKDHTVEYYGKTYLKDYGKDIPVELYERFQKTWIEFWEIQKEVRKYLK